MESKINNSKKDFKREFHKRLVHFTLISEYEIGDDTQLKKLQNELHKMIRILTSAILTMKGRSRIHNS